MAKILFSTILRNRETFLPTWHRQLCELSRLLSHDHVRHLSIFENDSDDDTRRVHTLDFSRFRTHFCCTAKLGTEYFGSVVDPTRVENLARARQQTLRQFPALDEMDLVVSVEPDVVYKPADVAGLINLALEDKWDVLSGISLLGDTDKIHDNWGARKAPDEMWWQGPQPDDLQAVWSTYHCVCIYNAKGFQAGANFGGYNRRLQTFDCDTAVVCEEFRERGFTRIGIHGGCPIRHYFA